MVRLGDLNDEVEKNVQDQKGKTLNCKIDLLVCLNQNSYRTDGSLEEPVSL
jgi:hypothetical protein